MRVGGPSSPGPRSQETRSSREAEKAERPGFFSSLIRGFLSGFGLFSSPKPSEPSGPPLLRTLRTTAAPALVPGPGGYQAAASATHDGWWGKAAAPPGKDVLRQVRDFGAPLVVTPQIEVGATVTPYAMVLPTGFDPDRSGGHAVRALLPPPGMSFHEAVKTLAESSPQAEDTVFVLADPALGKDGRAFVEERVLDELSDYGLDLGRYTTQTLPAAAAEWRTAIEGSKGEAARLAGPVISDGAGGWTQLAPSHDYKKRFPSPAKVTGSDAIPKALQKQPGDSGRFFVPVLKSEALESDVRVGVYLPPGYDPDAKAKYPVLFLLPGRGNPLSHWTSAGQLIPKLDRMMQGDAQKMIVVVPDGNDSYFVNEGEGKRFGDLVTDELRRYATEQLKGDPKRLSIGGISRGGYGAMALAADNPGLFKSVSSHSGALGEQRNGAHPQNPTRLAEDGKLAQAGQRLWVDIGAKDPYFIDETVHFAHALKKQGVDVETRVLDLGEAGGHNWSYWGPALESWLAFHQDAHGKAGPAPAGAGQNQAPQLIASAEAQSEAGWKALEQQVKRLDADAGRLASRIDALGKTPFGDPAAMKRRLKGATEDLASAKAGLAHRSTAVYSDARAGSAASAGRALRALDAEVSQLEREAVVLDQLSAAAKREVLSTLEAAPSLREPLIDLVDARPDLFAGKDQITKKAFARQLRKHVEDVLTKKDLPGFAEFLRRIPSRKYLWKVGGYSHSVCASLVTFTNHPSLVLDLVEAARSKKPYPLHTIYDGDGPKSLRPTEDLADAYRPLSGRSRSGGTIDSDDRHVLEGAPLAYERGLLRAVVDELRPDRLTPDRPAGRCDPVGVALSKLTGQEVRYAYAYNIKDGKDLAKAIMSQDGEGLAMADVNFTVGGRSRSSHFPVFYDYDPKTNECSVQDFSSPPKRISLDDLRFDAAGSHRPAVYYRPNDRIAPFLTIEEQFAKSKPAAPSNARWGEQVGDQLSDL